MNHLEQLVGEWLEYNGYFVRRSVPVGKRARGGYSGELDVVAFKAPTQHLLHIECSLDSDSWPKREARFAEKLRRGQQYIKDVFPGHSLPDRLEQKIVLQYTSEKKRMLAGAMIIPVRSFIREIFEGLKHTSPASGAVPSIFPLLRTLQLATDALAHEDGGERLVPDEGE